MIKTTVGQFLANDPLPASLRDYNRIYDQKGMDHVLEVLAHEHPEKYREVTKKLADLGGEVAFREGGLTFGTEHLQRPAAVEALAKTIEQQAHKIYLDPALSKEQRNKAIVSLLKSNQGKMVDASYGQALKEKNPLAMQAALGFRGNKSSINGMIGAGLLYSDYKGDDIPFPITRSFSQGLSPLQFLASTFGGRTGVISTKLNTAEAGALNKQLTQSAHQVMVDRDDEEGDWHIGTSPRGLPVDTGDRANIGTFLAHETAGYAKNTILTPKILRDLQEKGEDRILVRSPLVGGTAYGGVHARDLGIRNSRGIPQAGSFIGVETGQGVGEPLTQLQLSRKHGGGVSGGSSVGGFKLIEALANPPKQMPFGAAHAQVDGRIDRIDENPAGGKDIWIGNKKHYVPSQMGLKIKPGDTVEAGDVLSEGVPNPRDVVAHKGVGEGRRYLMQTMHDAYRDSGVNSRGLRRNLEPVVRGLVDHVVMTDFWNGHVPDDVVKYSHIENNWTPRPGYMNKNPRAAVGKYLESPVLHHTVGTQVRASMIPELERFKVNQVMVHNDPPPFQPNLLRATENLQHDPDWQVRLGGQYLQRGLLDSAHRGLTSSTTGSSFIPALIRGDNLDKSMSKQPNPFSK